jgi:hypothetical protein
MFYQLFGSALSHPLIQNESIIQVIVFQHQVGYMYAVQSFGAQPSLGVHEVRHQQE